MSTTPDDPQQLRTEITPTRAGLSETVEALAAKTDVKARVKQSAADLAERGREQPAATGDKVTAAADTAKDTIIAGTESVREQARTAPSKAASASRDPQGPIVVAALAAVGVILVIRGSRA